LRVEVDRLGVGARVSFLERPEEAELPGLIGASTLFAAPSLDDGSRGRQVARALACGVPVLASDLPRLRYLVEHEGTGLLVPAGDEEAWTRAVQRASSSPGARQRWSRRARELAEERLDWRRVAEVFETILADARARQAA
jgi:glycosyltransferase involved in cell wall biosynthesis